MHSRTFVGAEEQEAALLNFSISEREPPEHSSKETCFTSFLEPETTARHQCRPDALNTMAALSRPYTPEYNSKCPQRIEQVPIGKKRRTKVRIGRTSRDPERRTRAACISCLCCRRKRRSILAPCCPRHPPSVAKHPLHIYGKYRCSKTVVVVVMIARCIWRFMVHRHDSISTNLRERGKRTGVLSSACPPYMQASDGRGVQATAHLETGTCDIDAFLHPEASM